MQKFSSCKTAIAHCIDHQYFSIAHLFNEEKTMDMHIHDCCEIYYSISGGRQFLIDNNFYDVNPGDLFVINQYESHYLSKLDDSVHERIVVSIDPAFMKQLSSDTTNLDYCFTHLTKRCHRIVLNSDQQARFLYFINKITASKDFGSDLIEQATFMEMLVELNRIFIHQHEDVKESDSYPDYQYNEQVKQILSYINDHIAEPLTIDGLAEHFYLSSSYICRIFKGTTGTTINKYINARRITKAKSLLATGLDVSDVCFSCGFNDYSNFLKSFKRAVGISPKKYAQNAIS